MRVSFGGRQIGVAKQFLDVANVVAHFKHVSREAVPQCVNATAFLNTGCMNRLATDQLNGPVPEWFACLFAFKQIRGGLIRTQIGAKYNLHFLGEHHYPVFFTLARTHSNKSPVHIHVGKFEIGNLT